MYMLYYFHLNGPNYSPFLKKPVVQCYNIRISSEKQSVVQLITVTIKNHDTVQPYCILLYSPEKHQTFRSLSELSRKEELNCVKVTLVYAKCMYGTFPKALQIQSRLCVHHNPQTNSHTKSMPKP